MEEHDAVSFYYNSVNNLLSMDPTVTYTTSEKFVHIEDKLRYSMICPYRNILDIYSREWLSIYRSEQLSFSPQLQSYALSIQYDVRSIVLLRFLTEWMDKIHLLIKILAMNNFLIS